MDAIGQRVRELISRSGSSQGEFAAQIGLDASKLSKSLSGARRFSSLDLARIAESSQVSVDWLLSGQETPLTLAARAETGTSSAQAVAEAKRLSDARSDITFLGYPQPWRPLGLPTVRGRLIDQGAALADHAARRFAEHGLDPTDAGLAGAVETAFGVDVAVGDLGPRFDGLCVSNNEVKLILAAQGALPWRQRFTVAHELGHLLVGDDQELHLDEDVMRKEGRSDTETRANAFAAALLMPEQVLREAVGKQGLSSEGFARLACRLRVSPSALAYRLLNFRLIDAGTSEQFRRQSAKSVAATAGADGEFAAEVAVAGRGRPPGLLARDSYAAYRAGKATLRPYANVLGVDADELQGQLESAGEQEGEPT